MKIGWSDFDISYLRTNYATKPLNELARILMRTPDAIYTMASETGLSKYRGLRIGAKRPRNPNGIERSGLPWGEADDMRIRLAVGKASWALIAKQLKRSPAACKRRSSDLATTIPSRGKPARAHYVAILTEECAAEGLCVEATLSNCRARRFTKPRWRAWARLKAQNYSFPGIGLVAHVNHSTVVHGINRLAEMSRAINRGEAS